MKHIHEDILERFILHRDTMGGQEVRPIEEHLSACPACRERLSFLQSIHDEMDSLSYEDQGKIGEFIGEMFKTATVIPLVPFHAGPSPETAGSKYTTVLAAMTTPQHKYRFHTIATYASQSENTVLRVTHDKKTETLRLSVQSLEMDQGAYSIVSFSELASDFVTDENGSVVVGLNDSLMHTEWNTLKPVLHLKVLEFPVAPQKLLSASNERPLVCISGVDAMTTVQVYVEGEELVIIAETSQYTRALVDFSGRHKVLVHLESGTGRCAMDRSATEIRICLYQ